MASGADDGLPNDGVPDHRVRRGGGDGLDRLQDELRGLRERRGLTLREMAPLASYTASALSRATTGSRRPSWQVVVGYVTACQGDLDFFRPLWEAAGPAGGPVAAGGAVTGAAAADGAADRTDRIATLPVAGGPIGAGSEPVEPAPPTSSGVSMQNATTDPGPGPAGPPPPPPTPPPPRRRRWRRTLLIGVAVVLVAALVVAAAVFGPRLTGTMQRPPEALPAGQCAPDVVVRGPLDECVGVTDGGYTFDPALNLGPVLQRIKQQNDRVYDESSESQRPTVSIAYVAGLPTGAGGPDAPEADALAAEQIRKELVGVLLAQLRANEGFSIGDTPKIRVLVANVGAGGAQWRPVLQSLVDQAMLPNRLVGVTGLGAGIDRTQIVPLVAELARREVPVFPSRFAADALSTAGGPPAAGLFQVAPGPAAEATVVADHAARISSRILVVADQAPDNASGRVFGDTVATTLGNRPGVTLLAPLTLTSGRGGQANPFFRLSPQVCARDAQTVVFAGRSSDVPAFLQAMGARSCLDRPLTVLTGADGVTTALSLRRDLENGRPALAAALRSGRLEFRYAGLVHPSAWQAPLFAPAATAPFTDDCVTCLSAVDQDATADDGISVMAYDAALVPITALRMAEPSGSGPNAGSAYAYGPELVLRSARQITGSTPLAGASGRIAFDARGTVVDKADPIVELQPDGEVTFVQ